MWSGRDETVIGYNEHVQQFKQDAKNQDLEVCLLTFNGNVFEHEWNVPAEKLNEATVESYQPGGSTALRDAVGYVIDKHLANDDPEYAHLVIIISDGRENASRQYSPEMISELFEGCEKSGRWTFTFMGCDQAHLLGTGMKINESNVARWNNKDKRSARRGMKGSRKAAARYMAARVETPNLEKFCCCDANEDYWMPVRGAEGAEGAPGTVGPVGPADLTAANPELDNSTYVPEGNLCSTVFSTSNCVIGEGVEYSRPKTT
jgi:hypothetical protein